MIRRRRDAVRPVRVSHCTVTRPTLPMCVICGQTTSTAIGWDDADTPRWLCREHLDAELARMRARHPSNGRRT